MGKAWPALDVHVPACDPQLFDLVLAELDDFSPTAVHEPIDASGPLRVFFARAAHRDDAVHALGAAFGRRLHVDPVDVDDEDWAARSQQALGAVTVGRLVISPPWHTYEKGVRPLFIDPSMGFGTGHHATTRLVLRALQDIPVAGRTVLDAGCGSGVLAITAVTLGAESAVAVDVDPDAVANARDNVTLNGLDARVSVLCGDFREAPQTADIVLANLTGALLQNAAARLADALHRGGHLIVSGFMESEREAVIAALAGVVSVESVSAEDEWLCAVCASRRTGPNE